jgi:LytS/YehU family sensor histidine kinase
LKLSEILSYQLYESEHEVVPLEKELSAINNFIAISNLTTPGCQITLKIIGDPSNRFITSLLLLSFIHNTFAAIDKYKNEKATTGVVISLRANTLTVILTLKNVQSDIILNNLNVFVVCEQQRMNLFFAQNNCVTRLTQVQKDVQLSLTVSVNRAAKNATLIKKQVYESA